MKEFFLQQIEEATTLDQLDYVYEKTADQIENNDDVIEIYEAAMKKAQMWQEV